MTTLPLQSSQNAARLDNRAVLTSRPEPAAVLRPGPMSAQASASNDATGLAEAGREPAEASPASHAATRDPFANPLRIWTDLATIAGEMMLASAQVIGHRTGRMTWRAAAPSARDFDELSLMSQEKLEAAAESSQAMSAQMTKMNQEMWAQSVRRMQDTVLAMVSLAGSRDFPESIARHAELVRVMTGSTDAGSPFSQFSCNTARLARSALRPLHARATANAKRLGMPKTACKA